MFLNSAWVSLPLPLTTLQTTTTFSKMVSRAASMDSVLMLLVLQLKRRKAMMAGADTIQRRINKNPQLTKHRNANGKQTMWKMRSNHLVDPLPIAITILQRRPSQTDSQLDNSNKIRLASALRNRIPSRPPSKKTPKTSLVCTPSRPLNSRSQLKR